METKDTPSRWENIIFFNWNLVNIIKSFKSEVFDHDLIQFVIMIRPVKYFWLSLTNNWTRLLIKIK